MGRSLRISSLAALIAAAGYVLAGCGGDGKKNPVSPGGGGGTADLVIHIKVNSAQLGASAYTPNPATVTAGQTVQWINDDNMTHTATADGGSFDTGNLGAGARSAIDTMSTQGSFPYHCEIPGHSMTGTINVNP